LLKKPDISIQDKAKFSQELQTIIDENPDFKSESHTKVSQGGDKHRLTLTTFQVVRGWFDPDSTPAGEIPVNILIVPSAKHCRLEDITPEGTWERDVQYQIDDELIQYKKGEKVNQILAGWRKVRDDQPDQSMFQHLRIWGQPSGWTDEIITNWLSEYVKELAPNGCLQIVDCLGSQWSETTLARCWINQQFQIPIAPNATSILQVADTHIHSELKAYVVQAKQELQEQWDRIALVTGQCPSTDWGPYELASVCGQALEKLQTLQTSKDIVLKGFIQNQLLTYRPDANGQLQRVKDLWPELEEKFPRNLAINEWLQYMSCHAMPCHAMPCHAMPCHAMPCHAMPCHAMPCHAMPCHAMPCSATATAL
jgi:hypothetical protein